MKTFKPHMQISSRVSQQQTCLTFVFKRELKKINTEQQNGFNGLKNIFICMPNAKQKLSC